MSKIPRSDFDPRACGELRHASKVWGDNASSPSLVELEDWRLAQACYVSPTNPPFSLSRLYRDRCQAFEDQAFDSGCYSQMASESLHTRVGSDVSVVEVARGYARLMSTAAIQILVLQIILSRTCDTRSCQCWLATTLCRFMGFRDVGPWESADLTFVSTSGRRRASYRLENTVKTVRVANDPAEPSTRRRYVR
jgi:hypothetical protein